MEGADGVRGFAAMEKQGENADSWQSQIVLALQRKIEIAYRSPEHKPPPEAFLIFVCETILQLQDASIA